MTSERLAECHKGVEMIVGQQVVKQVPYDMIARLNASLIQLIDCERQLLGFPSPGKRRDESGIIDTSRPVIDTAIGTLSPARRRAEQEERAEQLAEQSLDEPTAEGSAT